MPRFAANASTMFNEVPYLDRFARMADMGFKAVECQNPYGAKAAVIRKAVEKAGLAFVLINVPAGERDQGELGFAAIPGRDKEFRAGLDLAVSYAKVLHCSCIHVLAGVVSGTRGNARKAYIANLRIAADICGEADITPVVEAINSKDVPGYFVNNARDAAALMDEADRPNLRLQFDVYHAYTMGEDPIAGLKAHIGRIAHVQVSSPDGRHEPVSDRLDFPAVFRALDELGYAGWVGCEYKPKAGTVEGLGWAKAYGIGR